MAFKVKKKNEISRSNCIPIEDHGRMLNLNDRDLNSVVWWDVVCIRRLSWKSNVGVSDPIYDAIPMCWSACCILCQCRFSERW